MMLLHRTVPLRWSLAALLAVALMLTGRAHEVLAINYDHAADEQLDAAHLAYGAGEFDSALTHAQLAIEESPEDPIVLAKASDYAFVLGMSLYTHSGTDHAAAFALGMKYASAAHDLDPESQIVHRSWAEGLLLAYLYELPVDRAEVRSAWESLPASTSADTAYRATALRLIEDPVNLAMN